MEPEPTVRPAVCVALLVVAATVFVTAAQADRHDRDEQLIHSLVVFNGSGYSRTFSAESSGTIYLLADTDNFVTLRKTFVFYRPSDDALDTDTTLLDAVVDGSLEISGGDVNPRSLSMEDYTYYNLRSDGAARWRTATGRDAHHVYADYKDKLSTYREGLDAYRLDRATYDYMVGELERRIEEQNRAGGDTARLEEVLGRLVAPTGPEFPEEYAAAPIRVDRAFVVNLPAGSYRTRLVRGDGRVLEGSEKTIVAFGRFGEPTIGYEVIPGDKWNRPEESNSGGSVIYVNGSSDLYLVAYHQHEFIDLHYEKLLRNDARGIPGMRRSVFVQEIPGVRIAVLGHIRGHAPHRQASVVRGAGADHLTRIPNRPVRPRGRARRSRTEPGSVSHRPGPVRPPHPDRADQQPRCHHRRIDARHPDAGRIRIARRPGPSRPSAAGIRECGGFRPTQDHLGMAEAAPRRSPPALTLHRADHDPLDKVSLQERVHHDYRNDGHRHGGSLY